MSGNSHNQSGEQQRRNDRPDEIQKDQTQQPEVDSNAGPIIADLGPDNHGGENPGCQRFSPPRITDKYKDDDPANDGHDLMLALSAGMFLR